MAIGAGSDPEIHKRVPFSWNLEPGTCGGAAVCASLSASPGRGLVPGSWPLTRGLVAQLVRARA